MIYESSDPCYQKGAKRWGTYYHGQFTDHVYANENIVRVDKNAAQMDLSAYTTNAFPIESAIWAGETSSYKLYQNPTMSIYGRGSITLGDVTLGGLIGEKIDLVTGVRYYKKEDKSFVGNKTCAVKIDTYDESGIQVASDHYMYITPAEMKDYCGKYDLAYPIPEEYENDVWIWGIYYAEGNVPLLAKAYREVE